MALANMISLDENALICDLAETYHIYDYRSLPVFTVAALSVGLRENSRIRTLSRGGVLIEQDYTIALIYDLLARWSTGKDMESLTDLLDGKQKKQTQTEPKKKTESFDSPEEFEQARRKAMGKD